MEENDFETLSGQDAIDLWLEGEHAWNEWVEKNPDYNIDFSNTKFSEYCENKVDFSGYYFPNGKVDFSFAKFGQMSVDFFCAVFGYGFVSFENTTFSNGNVDFSESRFKDTIISFKGAKFGNGDIFFCNAQMGDGEVNFSNTIFSNGNLDFSHTYFGKGDFLFNDVFKTSGDIYFEEIIFEEGNIDFSRSKLDESNISFNNAQFGKGDVSFTRSFLGNGETNFCGAHFGDGEVNFSNTSFKKGSVRFSNVDFGNGKINFANTDFGTGIVDFFNAQFGTGNVFFFTAKFGGLALFDGLSNIRNIQNFSFKYATFDGPLDISCADGEAFPCLIDLTHTKTSHHVSLEGLNFNLTEISKEDEERARRLKELAETNKDHDKAKNFHIIELQVAKKFRGTQLSNLLDTAYEKLSYYGSSISRPVGWMVFIWLLWAEFYMAASLLLKDVKNGGTVQIPWSSSLTYSAAQMFAFIPSSRSARMRGEDILYGDSMSEWIYLLTFSQSIFALILLFLLGLGLRHRYRI